MVCEFAPQKGKLSGCSKFQSDSVTCIKDNGGPFSASGRAYCGMFRRLEGSR